MSANFHRPNGRRLSFKPFMTMSLFGSDRVGGHACNGALQHYKPTVRRKVPKAMGVLRGCDPALAMACQRCGGFFAERQA